MTFSLDGEDSLMFKRYVDLSELPDVKVKETAFGIEIHVAEKDLDIFFAYTSQAIVVYGMDNTQDDLTDVGVKIDRMFYILLYQHDSGVAKKD